MSEREDKQELMQLRKRVDYLERINQQYISTLDTLNSLGDIHGNVKQKRSPQHIFSSTRQYICRLAHFDLTAFLMVNEENNSFEIDDCIPLNAQDELQDVIDQLIDRGEFGWALNQNRICEPQLRMDGRRILLHVLASRTRIRGMFVGVLNETESVPSVMTLGLISAILYNSAYALESATLYKMVLEQNEMLESKVIDRTQELNQAQQALKKSNEELEERVKLRTAELSSSNKKLIAEVDRRKKIEDSLRNSEEELIIARQFAESASQAKSEFLSKMSHELRTPLNAILGFSQVLELDEEFLKSSNAPFIEEIRTAGEHLLALINEVLDLSKIEAGKIDVQMENVNIGEIMRECYALIKPMAMKKNIKLLPLSEHAEKSYIYADRTLIKQVFINLLSNAVKYNKQDGNVEVKVTEQANRVNISVIDNGVGIQDDKKQFMFQPFNRLGVESTNIEGTGMGLVITQHLVLLMNGEIDFNSEYGQGTEFILKINPGFASFERSAENTDKTHEIVSTINGFTMLYIEDSAPNIRLVESILSKWPQIELHSALSAEEGIERVNELKPDIILMDINLPNMDGFEAVKLLKSKPETASIPVIALSANAMQKSVQEGLDAGFERYLTKPLKVVEFLKLLGTLTGQTLLE